MKPRCTNEFAPEPDSNRGTGRTTRILENAVRIARSGDNVVVVFPNHSMARMLGERGVEKIVGAERSLLKRIQFVAIDINPDALRGVQVLFDHTVIETTKFEIIQ